MSYENGLTVASSALIKIDACALNDILQHTNADKCYTIEAELSGFGIPIITCSAQGDK